MKRYLYRILIVLHPRDFRERFGREMLCIFDESARDQATLPLLSDSFLSLLRQWFVRSSLWKFTAGAVISALMLCVWGYTLTGAVRFSTIRGLRLRSGLMRADFYPENQNSVNMAEFSRSAAEAVAIVRETEDRKRRSQRVASRHFAPNPAWKSPSNEFP